MCANQLGDIPRLVSYKPNDCLQITFYNECAKRATRKQQQNSCRVMSPNTRSDFLSKRSSCSCRSFNQRRNTASFFNRSLDNWQKHSQLNRRIAEQPFQSNSFNSHYSNNTSRVSNFTSDTGSRQWAGGQSQQNHAPAYRRSGHSSVNYTNTNNTSSSTNSTSNSNNNNHYHNAIANGGGASQSVPRQRVPLSHPSRYLEEPYRDYKPAASANSVSRPVRRTAPATPDIHQPPPSVFFKQRQLQRAAQSCAGSTSSGAQNRGARSQPQTAPPQKQQQRHWKNDWSVGGDKQTVNGGGGAHEIASQYHKQTTANFARPRENGHPERTESHHQRGKFTASYRRSRGAKSKQSYGTNQQGCHDLDFSHRKGRKQGAAPSTPPFSDEYIDDFTPEDLVKYKLQIDMENFTVQSPLISDPILNVPLSTTWLTDDLYQQTSTPATAAMETRRHLLPWQSDEESGGCRESTLGKQKAMRGDKQEEALPIVIGRRPAMLRTASLEDVCHRVEDGQPVYCRTTSCPAIFDADVRSGEVDGGTSLRALTATSLPGSLSECHQPADHYQALFHSRSHPVFLHVCGAG